MNPHEAQKLDAIFDNINTRLNTMSTLITIILKNVPASDEMIDEINAIIDDGQLKAYTDELLNKYIR